MKKSYILLTFCALFMGISGVFTQIALAYTSVMLLISIRFLLASLIGGVVFKINSIDWEHLKHSFILSLFLLGTYIFGVIGLKYTSASNAGFIVGSNVVLVPLINRFFFKYKASKSDYIKSIVCFIGLALVTLKGASPINIGDFYNLIGTISFSFYIIYNNRMNQNLDSKKLVTYQYSFVGLISLIYALLFENTIFSFNANNILAIMFLSVFCTFLSFYMQIIAQREVSSEKASQVLALMPIFAVLFDIMFFNTLPTIYVIVGGLLIIISTMQFKEQKPRIYPLTSE